MKTYGRTCTSRPSSALNVLDEGIVEVKSSPCQKFFSISTRLRFYNVPDHEITILDIKALLSNGCRELLPLSTRYRPLRQTW